MQSWAASERTKNTVLLFIYDISIMHQWWTPFVLQWWTVPILALWKMQFGMDSRIILKVSNTEQVWHTTARRAFICWVHLLWPVKLMAYGTDHYQNVCVSIHSVLLTLKSSVWFFAISWGTKNDFRINILKIVQLSKKILRQALCNLSLFKWV